MYKKLLIILISLSLCSSYTAAGEPKPVAETSSIDSTIANYYNPLVFLGFEFACITTAYVAYRGYKCYKQYQVDNKSARNLINEYEDSLKRIKQIHHLLLKQPHISTLPDSDEKILAMLSFKNLIVSEEYKDYRYPFIGCKKRLKESINECIEISKQLKRRINRIKQEISDHKEYISTVRKLKKECNSSIKHLTAIANEVEACYEYKNEKNILKKTS